MLDTSPPPGLERMQVQLFQGQADISIALSVLEEEKSGPVHFLHPVTATWSVLSVNNNAREGFPNECIPPLQARSTL